MKPKRSGFLVQGGPDCYTFPDRRTARRFGRDAMAMERTFCMIKPDAVMRGLAGEILSRIEKKGLRISAMKMVRLSEEQARRLYQVHEGRPFFPKLIRFVTSAPAIVLVVEGFQAIQSLRNLMGATAGFEAAAGTIRGDLALSRGKNLVHGSDSAESARKEIAVFFQDSDLLEYSPPAIDWTLEADERR